MKIPPQLRPGVIAPPRPGHAPAIRYRLRSWILLLRVLVLCFHTAAHAQPVSPATTQVTPEQKFAPGYLEAVATGYDNGQAFNAAEGIAPVRQPRAVRTEPAPPMPAPAPAAVMTPASGNLRRISTQ